ncbi:MAG: carboxypeptidase-like regulatory domain-containing protein, partial [Planctomycetaceae bacterium]
MFLLIAFERAFAPDAVDESRRLSGGTASSFASAFEHWSAALSIRPTEETQMRKRSGLKVPVAAFALLLAAMPLGAQETGTVTGIVTDARTGDPVVGATVEVEESASTVLTNVDGRYLLLNVPIGTQMLTVSGLGYGAVERAVAVASGTNQADFQLEAAALQLDALVVTGQQIERQAREIAYSVSTVEGEELTEVRETNFVDALAGRSPGVQVISQSGNIGASTRIVIRGISSLSGDNQPLFVVDGVPISNSNIVAGTSQDRLTG